MNVATDILPATGSSMFPFVLAGSVLHLRTRGTRAIRIGDIVCHPDRTGQLVAHRVRSVSNDGNRTWLTTRGDALEQEERLPSEAIAWVVERVEHRWLRYDTGGLLGRTLSRVAIRHRALHRAATLAARALRRARAQSPSRSSPASASR